MEIIFLIGRILFGGFFLMNGINHFKHKNMLVSYAKSKNAPSPETTVPLTGVALIFSGLSIILGIFFQLGFILLIIFLLVVNFKMHAFWKETDPNSKMSDQTHFMKNLALLGAILIMFVMMPGPWPLSLANVL